MAFPETINGTVTFDDCQNYVGTSETNDGYETYTGGFTRSDTFSKSMTLELADTPNDAYGANTRAGATYGNGLGEIRDQNDFDAIRYFSFTGSAPWNTRFGAEFWNGESLAELSDVFLLVMRSLFPIPGQRTEKDYMFTWLGDTAGDLLSGDTVEVNYDSNNQSIGYTKASDAFIPVESTPFGQHIATFEGWNHVDETNGLWGLVGQGAANPIDVYREHINRLQLSGL